MKIISVIRNSEMYNKLVKNNPFNQGADFYPFDNREENKNISIRYNDFLDTYDYSKPDWFVFCHEDWEIQEDWKEKFENLDKNCLYGPIGVEIKSFLGFASRIFWGQIKNSDKDGGNLINFGCYADKEKQVGTFDCQCLIVHSDLIKQYKLRFDENLSWDLYVEDFCIQAREAHGIISKILQLSCQHYSHGNLNENYYAQLASLQEKYRSSIHSYSTTASKHIIGKKNFILISEINDYSINNILFSSGITRKGKRLIKICKIPVYSKKVI